MRLSASFRRPVSTHSRLKAAGPSDDLNISGSRVSTHSRLKAAGGMRSSVLSVHLFQHTAA